MLRCGYELYIGNACIAMDKLQMACVAPEISVKRSFYHFVIFIYVQFVCFLHAAEV